jgi:NTE family protein
LAPLKKTARAGRSAAPKRTAPAAPVARSRRASPEREECILVLQGGGALGAYQAGVYECLAAMRQTPEWIAGISIGAINAALIAGNRPEHQVERLREFWEMVSSFPFGPRSMARRPTSPAGATSSTRQATIAMLFGVSGFFAPRVPAAPFKPPGTPAAISYTTPSRCAAARAAGRLRLLNSGACASRSGRSASRRQLRLLRQPAPADRRPTSWRAARCRRASADRDRRRVFWDGGLVSNTPLQYVLDQPATAAAGVPGRPVRRPRRMPPTWGGERAGEGHPLLEPDPPDDDLRAAPPGSPAARRLVAKLPPALQDDPDARALAALPLEAAVAVVHLIYRSKHYESQSRTTSSRAPRCSSTGPPAWPPRPRSRIRAGSNVNATTGRHVFDMTSPSGAPPRPSPQLFTEDFAMSTRLQDRSLSHRRRQRIGLAVAEIYAREGAKVAIADLNMAAAQAAAG